MTSHAHLLLLSEDNSLSEWYVAIIANDTEYHIEYQMTKDTRPWENATVKGGTRSIEEFKKFLIIAMFESQGWKSGELGQLFTQIKAKG